MPDIEAPPALTAADIADEIWLEVARQHADGLPARQREERVRLPSPGVALAGGAPGPLPLPALLALDGTAFVEAAYSTVLGRPADPTGLALLEGELAHGRSKIEILGALQGSAEGRQRGRELPGLKGRYLAHRLYRVPVAGKLARAGAAVLRRSGVSHALFGRESGSAVLRAEIEQRVGALEAAMDARRRALEDRLVEQQTAAELAARRLASMQAAQDEMSRRMMTLLAEQGRGQTALAERAEGFARQLMATEDSVIESLLNLNDRLAAQETRLAGIEGVFDAAAAKRRIEQAADGLRAELEARVAEAEALVAANRKEVADQQHRIGLMLHALRDRVPPAVEALDDHAMDALYVAFEAKFRGSRAVIKDRQRVYLPRLGQASGATGGLPALDVGAGRGEFLEMMREAGLPASGIDLNEAMVEACLAAGLACEQGDALGGLAARADASLSAITGFHIVEHLPFKMVVRIIDEALRVLAPGGLLVLETPNPGNLLVATRSFWVDPTHRKPLPPELLAMVAEARGFPAAEILPLHPAEGRLPGDDRALAGSLEAMLYGPRDYALVAWKR